MPCADFRTVNQGSAIILALITVALAAGIAAALLATLGSAVDGASGRHQQTQARLLAQAATDWARNILAEDARTTAVDHLQEPWTIRVPPTPVEQNGLEGEVSGEIEDWSGRFNINNLAPDGQPDETARQEFERLLSSLNVRANANSLSLRIQQWLSTKTADKNDKDGQVKKTAHTINTQDGGPHAALADITELRALSGVDDALMAQINPFVIAAPAPSKVNINTAPAEILAAVIDGLGMDQARVIAAQRDQAWFRDMADLKNRLPQGITLNENRLDVRSRFFLVTGRTRSGMAMVKMQVLLDRQNNWADIVWQRIL